LKLTQLIRFGLVTSSILALSGALSACDSGDSSFAPDGPNDPNGSGSGNFGQGGSQGLGTSGNGSMVTGGSANNPTAGSSSNPNGGNSNPNGGSANPGGGTGNVTPPCTNLPPNNGDTCEHAVEYGWCNQDWLGESCHESCGKCSNGTAGTGAGGNASGGSGNNNGGSSTGNGGFGGGGGQPPKIEGGTQGFATRYWDCCKPHCAWKGNVPGGNAIDSCNRSDQNIGVSDADNACENPNSGVYMCHNYAPWAVSDTLAYGFAAFKSNDICGRCYQLQFTGSSNSGSNDPGSQSLSGKTMIVQAINTGNIQNNQFDLLIPGGGVGEYDACSDQWGTSSLGEQFGGFYLDCQKKNGFNYAAARTCAANKCQEVLGNKPELLAGCNFFINWFAAADNPNLVYKEVACPAAITAVSGLSR
jgi:hypothetical protein